MGLVFAVIGYGTGLLAVLLGTFCIACGLFYAAELAEGRARASVLAHTREFELCALVRV